MESLAALTPYDLTLNLTQQQYVSDRHEPPLLFNLSDPSFEDPFGLDAINTSFPYALNDSQDSPAANGTDPNKYNLPWWHEVIWYVVFMGMVIVATGGNLIVIWIVLADRRMRTVTNIFLVNLSVADAMVSTLNVVFNFTYMLNLHWRFGLVYCKISQFVSILSICASVFTLMAISFDR